MNKILRLFKYAGYSLLLIALFITASHIITAISDYKNGMLSVNMLETRAKQETILLKDARFTYSNFGVYEFKPSLTQALVLSGDGLSNTGVNAIFFLLTGAFILIVAYKKPRWLEHLTEVRLWQFIGAGGFLFLGLKFLLFYMVDRYVGSLTDNLFKYRTPGSGTGYFNIEMLSLVVIITIIYELLSYSRKLKEENDLTI